SSSIRAQLQVSAVPIPTLNPRKRASRAGAPIRIGIARCAISAARAERGLGQPTNAAGEGASSNAAPGGLAQRTIPPSGLNSQAGKLLVAWIATCGWRKESRTGSLIGVRPPDAARIGLRKFSGNLTTDGPARPYQLGRKVRCCTAFHGTVLLRSACVNFFGPHRSQRRCSGARLANFNLCP